MTKKKTICQYELLCIKNKEDKKLIASIENFLGLENIKERKEEKWQPVYKINQSSQPSYLLINFTAPRQKIPGLEKNILQVASKNILFRYNLINLTDEPRQQIKKKNVK